MTTTTDTSWLSRVDQDHLKKYGYTAAEARNAGKIGRAALEQLALKNVARVRNLEAEIRALKHEHELLQGLAGSVPA